MTEGDDDGATLSGEPIVVIGASVGTLAAAMAIGASDGTDTGADTGLGAKDVSDDGCLGSIEGDDTDGVVPIGDAD